MKFYTRMTALAVALFMVFSCSIGVLAASYDLCLGDISVEADSSGQKVTQNAVTTSDNEEIVITTSSTTGNTVSISSSEGATAQVTLQEVNINTDKGNAVDISDGSKVEIDLEGENRIVSSNGAGVHVGDAEVTITGTDAGDEMSIHVSTRDAAIGSEENEDFSGTVNFTATKVIAYSDNGAGIGAGVGGDFTGSVNIEDSGFVDGNCVAGNSAGIGSGEGGDFSGSVQVENTGKVYGGSAHGGSGIGSGAGGNFTSSGSITVRDSTIGADTGYMGTDENGNTGTAIGAADCCEFNGTISVTGDSSLHMSDLFYPGDDPLIGRGYGGTGNGSVTLGDDVGMTYYDYKEDAHFPLNKEDIPEAVGGNLNGEGTVSNTDRFWYNVRNKIRNADEGATITVDAGRRTFMPLFVLDAVKEYKVTLVIQWAGGDDITLQPSFDGTTDKWSFQLADLADMTKK